MNGALDAVAGLPAPAVLAVAAALLAIESGSLAGLAVPGTTILFALGVWTHSAPPLLPVAVATAAIATVAGAHASWWRGRRTHSTAARSDDRRPRLPHQLAPSSVPATALLLAVGHWSSPARPTLPRWAGSVGVRYRVGGPVFVASGTAWATTVVLLAHHVGVDALLLAGSAPLVVLLLLLGALALSLRARQRSA